MPIYVISLSFLVLFISSCSGPEEKGYPDYYRHFNQLLRFEKAEKYDEALEEFRKAEKLVSFIPPQNLYRASIIAGQAGNCELCGKYFQQALRNGYELGKRNHLEKYCPQLKDIVLSPIVLDTTYKWSVDSMHGADQAARRRNVFEEYSRIDSLNMSKMLKLIQEKGFPSAEKIGHKSARSVGIVLLHFDRDTANTIFGPILEKALFEGKISPDYYAWIYDRRRHWGPKGLDPYYYQLPSKKYFDMTESEIAEIDRRRDAIGLPPLEEMNITLTDDGNISWESMY